MNTIVNRLEPVWKFINQKLADETNGDLGELEIGTSFLMAQLMAQYYVRAKNAGIDIAPNQVSAMLNATAVYGFSESIERVKQEGYK